MTIRPHQRAALDALYDYWRKEDGHGLIVVPTGGGKSYIAAALIQELSTRWPGTRILVLQHVKELISQNHAELKKIWPEAPAGIYSAGLKRKDFHADIVFAGIQSIASNCQHLDPPPEIVIIDECHLIPRKDTTRYKKTLETLKQMYPSLRMVGLSATPFRLDSGWLHTGADAMFDKIVYDIPIQQLIDDGYLAPLITKAGSVKINTAGIHHSGGEFVAGELEAAAMSGDTTALAVSDMVIKAQDRKKWLVFACGVKHAEQIKDELEKHNINTEIVTGDTSNRDDIIADFRNGTGLLPIRCIVNIQVMTTGVNIPDLDMIAMLRPTESASLYVQIAGRGMRTAPGKTNCLVLDYAGNCMRHGPIDAVSPNNKPWSEEGGGVAPAKECPKCMSIIHCSKRICQWCGYEFPPNPIVVERVSSEAPILSSQVEPEVLKIKHTDYEIHLKADKKPSICVTYYHGEFDKVKEWIFPEAHWQRGEWEYRKFCLSIGMNQPVPRTADEFMDRLIKESAQAEEIIVKKEGKFDRVVSRKLKEKQKYSEEIPF